MRTRAFSALSSLSTYTSQKDHYLPIIMHDIKIATDAKSEVYLEQIKERLAQSQEAFR